MAELRVDEVAEEAALNEEPPTERERVRRWLLAELLHGRVPLPTEDDPRSEEWLAKESGAESRMPARMALAVLAGEGLVLQRARRGFWMVEYDSADIAQIVAMRADVEARVVGLLCEVGAPRDLDAWEQAFQANVEMRELVQTGGAPADFADLEAQFHVGLALSADLRVAARYIDEWSNRMRLFELQNGLVNAPDQEAVDRHKEVIAALGATARDEAMDLIRRDVESLGPPTGDRERPAQVELRAESLEVRARNVEERREGYEVAES